MKKRYLTLSLFFIMTLIPLSDAYACFGDKLGVAYMKGAQEEFSAHLVALYIKEKTGIDSVVNEFTNTTSIEESYYKGGTDIMVLTGADDSIDVEKLAKEHEGSRFVILIEGGGTKIVFEVLKETLNDMRFFTIGKVLDRVGGIIKPDEFKKWVSLVKSGEKFPKQAAREYLLEKDLI